MFKEKVSLDLGKEQVCHKKYLRAGKHQVDGEVVVGVGRVVVDPELPGYGGQKSCCHHHTANNKRLKIKAKNIYSFKFKTMTAKSQLYIRDKIKVVMFYAALWIPNYFFKPDPDPKLFAHVLTNIYWYILCSSTGTVQSFFFNSVE
jgi:hypothetical protein